MHFLIALLSLSWSAAANVNPEDLKYLFDRPSEPILTLRGLNRTVAYDVPVSYLPERYQRIAGEVRRAARRAGVRLIPVPDLPMPSGRFADVNTVLPYRSPYSRSAPPLLDLTIRFWHFFAESKTIDELLARVVWARLHFNPEMILDALVLTFLRSSLKGLPVSIPVLRNLSKDEEAVLWYYREDAHLNVFHWKWHLIYPTGSDDPAYVDLPRRGEMFVHLHRQLTGRYHAERFSNGLPAVTPIDVHRQLKNGFFPKMVHLHGAKGTIGRQANTSLLPRTTFIANHDREVKLYDDVLRQGYVTYSNGTKVKLVGIAGLDIISNLLEGNSVLSPDNKFYGNMHNDLHENLAAAQDPLGKYNEPFAVTSYITTVIKDSVFFNIHQFMDNKYEEYKRKLLKPYTKADTTPLPKVVLQSVSVQTDGASKAGELRTFWQLSDLDVSQGLDYTPPGRLYARFSHLQHRRFEYVLKVLNTERHARKVYVRLFLLMTQDETGSELSLDFQRRFSIQMDTFEATLRPGSNTLRRASNESALTVDTDAVYASQRGGAPATEVRRRNKCRCGWPQGLLLPRGTAKGMPFKLFAMVTDYHQDRAPKSDAETCHDGWLLCGVPGSTHYPDVRAMGFPFDRPFRAGVRSLGDFLTANMGVSDVVVKFENRTEGPSPLLPGGLSTSWMP